MTASAPLTGMLRRRWSPSTGSSPCGMDRDVALVALGWGAEFTHDLVGCGHGTREYRTIPAVLCCVSTKHSKRSMSRYFSLGGAIKMYLLAVALLIRRDANPSFILTLYVMSSVGWQSAG